MLQCRILIPNLNLNKTMVFGGNAGANSTRMKEEILMGSSYTFGGTYGRKEIGDVFNRKSSIRCKWQRCAKITLCSLEWQWPQELMIINWFLESLAVFLSFPSTTIVGGSRPFVLLLESLLLVVLVVQ